MGDSTAIVTTSPSSEEQIIALLIQEPEILGRWRNSFTKGFFTGAMQAPIAEMILDFYDDYGGVPSQESLSSMLEFLAFDPKMSRYEKELGETAARIYTPLKPSDHAFVSGHLGSVMKSRHLDMAMSEAIALVAAGNSDEALILLTKANEFSLTAEKEYLDLSTYDRTEYIESAEAKPVPTGIASIDEEMHGGLRPGHLGLVCGQPGAGKGMILVNFAKGALYNQRSTLYYSYEQPSREVAQRLDACMFDLDYHSISEDVTVNEGVQTMAKDYKSTNPGYAKSRIVYRPQKSETVVDFVAMVKRMYPAGDLPDVILLDYADLFKDSSNYGNQYADIGVTYSLLVAAAGSLMVPIWSATQANRDGAKVKLQGLDNLADSYEKARKAHTVYTINQTVEEEERHMFRLYAAKQRNYDKGLIHYFRTRFDRCRIEPIGKDEYKTSVTEAVPTSIASSIGKSGTKKSNSVTAGLDINLVAPTNGSVHH